MPKILIFATLSLSLTLPLTTYAEPFTAEHLVRLDRVGAPVVSPDGKRVAYAVRETDMEAGKGRHDLWVSPVAGAEPQRLTRHEANDTAPAWSPDGKWVYFLSNRGEGSQVWRIPPAGGEAEPVTDLPLDVGTFKLSPGAERIAVSVSVHPDCTELACSAERIEQRKNSSTSGAVYDQLFVRHWDRWLGETRSQLFTLTLEDGLAKQTSAVPVTADVKAEVPSRTWGGNEEYAFSPDGETVYFVAREATATEPWSTNFDIYSVPAGGGEVTNLTARNEAWDTRPLPAPNGKQLVYLAMSRPGYEADRFRIMLRDLESGATRELAPDWDRSASDIAFSSDGKFLYVTAQDMGNKTLWRLDIARGDIRKVVSDGTVNGFDVAGERLVFARDSLVSPSELFVLEDGEISQLTHFTSPQLENVQLGEYEQFSFEGAHGDTVYGYVMKPAEFEEGEKYPVAFLIHGGPQGSFGNHFHYRWNPQTYAGQGFAPVFIDFHGSTGYGQAFTDAIREDWGGAPLLDLQKGLAAALEKYTFLDGERACALGASYGGFMVNWIAGNWPDGFRCLVNHDGIFDQRMMYYTTEELWFPEWEQGGPYHENPEMYERFNPANFVENWRTPMLVIHGELDYRVPVTQGIATFTALQRRGVPSRLLYYPDENHWVLNPHNSLQWHSVVNGWLHRYLTADED